MAARTRSRLGRLITNHSNLIAAILTILTVIFGALLARGTQVVQQQNQTINTNVGLIEELRNQNVELKTQVAERDKRIKAFEKALPSSNPTTSLAPNPALTDPSVRHNGPLTLVSGISNTDTDLDAPQSDPNWGRESNTGDASGDAPYISGSEITTGRVGVPMRLMTEEVHFETCSALGDLSGNAIPIGNLHAGSNICLRTTAGRWAKLVVVADPSGDKIALNVTVWDPH